MISAVVAWYWGYRSGVCSSFRIVAAMLDLVGGGVVSARRRLVARGSLVTAADIAVIWLLEN